MTQTPKWLIPLIKALDPQSPTMRAAEQAERIMRAQRERNIRSEMDLQRWLRA